MNKPARHDQPYTNEELRTILMVWPTNKNAKRLAEVVERTPEAIKWIWGLSRKTDEEVDRHWGTSNMHVLRVRAICREIGIDN